MPGLPPLNALKCFEAAARSESFSRAAEELHVTQSAVSHQIRQLEDWFGFPLFDRRGRQTVPTPRGQELAAALAEAFGIVGTACRRVAQFDAAPSLTIAALPSIATIWLIPRLSGFMRDSPNVAVKVVYAFHGQPHAFDDIDIAILWGTGGWPEAKATRFLQGATVAVCNQALLEREGPFSSPADIAGKPLLHDTNRGGWQNWMKKAGIRRAEAVSGPVFEDFNLLRAAALAGQGLALCPKSLIADDLVSGRLRQLFDVTILEDHGYFIVEPEDPGHRHADAIALFKAWLLKEGQASPRGG